MAKKANGTKKGPHVSQNMNFLWDLAQKKGGQKVLCAQLDIAAPRFSTLVNAKTRMTEGEIANFNKIFGDDKAVMEGLGAFNKAVNISLKRRKTNGGKKKKRTAAKKAKSKAKTLKKNVTREKPVIKSKSAKASAPDKVVFTEKNAQALAAVIKGLGGSVPVSHLDTLVELIVDNSSNVL